MGKSTAAPPVPDVHTERTQNVENIKPTLVEPTVMPASDTDPLSQPENAAAQYRALTINRSTLPEKRGSAIRTEAVQCAERWVGAAGGAPVIITALLCNCEGREE